MVEKQEHGKIVIRFQGNYQQFDRLLKLFESGELEEALGTPVLEVNAFCLDKPKEKQQTVSVDRPWENLSEWFKGVYTSGWQSMKAFLDKEKTLIWTPLSGPEPKSAEGGKLIRVEMNLGAEITVLLRIKIQQRVEEEKVEILAQLLPTGGEKYLPSNLTLARLSKSGKVHRSVQSESMNNFIQIEFIGNPGGRFGIQVAYHDARLLEEYFVA